MAAFNDLRQFKNPKSVTSVNGTFPYGHIPRKHPGSVVIDHNSFTPDARRTREHRPQVRGRRASRRATS